jgi:hypothetical protein
LPYEDILGLTEGVTLDSSLRTLSELAVENVVNWGEINGEVFFQKVGVSNED